eukprot:Phypoly_transcript_18852.p1 GENE.Phypoly_transcript_18852~~Phypoly_transcript_18852.p1  ORF type:complete len:208 (+),score=46.22 Phypoly_transcript_18852:51-626(+)
MTEEFDFVESTPAAVPLSEHQFHTGDEEHVEETIEEIVEGDHDVGELGEHVTVHEEIIDTPEGGFPSPTLTTKDSTSDFHSSFSQPSALREYQIKHEEYLKEKATKSHEKHQAILDKAKSDIDNFYKERALKRDKAESANRSAEQQFITDRDANLAAGDSWESVGKLTDLQAKPLGKDTSRMKQVLVQLKH